MGHDRQTGDKMTDRLAVTVAQTSTPQGDRGEKVIRQTRGIVQYPGMETRCKSEENEVEGE